MSTQSLKTGNPSVVLLSGGLDSATVLYFCHKIGEDITPIFFNYDQVTLSKENECVYKLCKLLAIPTIVYIEIQTDFLKASTLALNRETALVDTSKPLTTFVPGRNIIFLAHAGAYAKMHNIERVYIGTNEVDLPSKIPDCYDTFLHNMEWALRNGLDHDWLRIYRPLQHMSKTSIIEFGQSLGVPWELTWSCHFNTEKPCGNCDHCITRAKAFEEAEIIDPLTRLF